MFRAKGSTRDLQGGPGWWPDNDIGDEEAGFYNEIRAVSGNLEEVPLTKDERIWIRFPVSVFIELIYNPASWVLRPLRPVFTTPHGLVGFLIVFLFVFIPFFIASGYLSIITEPRSKS